MRLETMAQLGEFIGGLGVIISFVYLAMQVRGNSRYLRADMTSRILDRLVAQQHTYAFDAKASSFFTQAINEPSQLTMEERARFAWLMTEFMGGFEFLLQQYQARNVDEETWLRWSATLDWWLTFPGVRAYWKGRPTPYTENFTKHVEDRLINGKGDFNDDNWRDFLLSGETVA